MKNNIFFPEIPSLSSNNFLAHLLCHNPYVTSFVLARQSQKGKISTIVKYFRIYFIFNNRYHNGLLKIRGGGGRVV